MGKIPGLKQTDACCFDGLMKLLGLLFVCLFRNYINAALTSGIPENYWQRMHIFAAC